MELTFGALFVIHWDVELGGFERFERSKINDVLAERRRGANLVPVCDLEHEIGRDAGGHHDLELFVPLGVESPCG